MISTIQAAFQFVESNIVPKPFLKWAGGKSQLLEQLTPFFPKRFARYSEPFTGSAAVYWHLFGLRNDGQIDFGLARLTDTNQELINSYLIVRDNVEQLIELLTFHKERHNKEHFYDVRGWDVTKLSPTEVAARFIYLNKTCYNGLYRVNRSGKFNVPMGNYKNPGIFDPDLLRKASRALHGVDIQVSEFTEILNWADKGDFIYFDPPYAPVSKTANFTSYTKNPFGEKQQTELAAVYQELDHRGCKLMLSNSWVESIINLYSKYELVEVQASRVINSNAKKRGKISELLVINYSP